VFEALTKMTTMPRHTYTTRTAAFTHGQPRSSETILADGNLYIRVNGMWTKSPSDSREMPDQQKENRERRKATCQFVRNELVGAESAALSSMHTGTEYSKEDAQIWISSSTGLPVREERDLDVGGLAGKEHRSTRFEYGNIWPRCKSVMPDRKMTLKSGAQSSSGTVP
jgi:hypothetical protein